MAQNPIGPRAPRSEGSGVLDEIPTSDPTYQHLGTVLIPHTRFPDMFLLEYQTFSGAMAYQPCSKNIDLQGFFTALEPIEKGGDPLFKVARSWSCIIQSIPELPKEVRWVLATIYDFSNEMMRPGTGEDLLWAMRQWLMYWFDMAESLFKMYDYPIYAPTMDWFLRPAAVSVEDDEEVAIDGPSSVSSDENRTVIHHEIESSPKKSGPLCRDGAASSGIAAWMSAQPDWATAFRQPFDPAPGGRVYSRLGTISQPRLAASARQCNRQEQFLGMFRLNPEAIEFDPNMNLTTSIESITSRSPSRTSVGSTGGWDTSSDVDGPSCSEGSLSSSQHLRIMIEAHGEDVGLWG
ncbi:hypothetical protein E4U41_004977 [Claviceps citrina]|nr:hypothetical protein E4U41_004977 [Claviceps citrina]